MVRGSSVRAGGCVCSGLASGSRTSVGRTTVVFFEVVFVELGDVPPFTGERVFMNPPQSRNCRKILTVSR